MESYIFCLVRIESKHKLGYAREPFMRKSIKNNNLIGTFILYFFYVHP